MGPTIRSFIRISGILLMFLGPALILTFLVSAVCGEWREGSSFLWLGCLVFLAGIASRALPGGHQKKMQLGDGFLLVTILWLLMCVIGALPYLTCGILRPVDAFFESCSGFTTTGATLFASPRILPHGILFWRAMTGWLGGIGTLLIAITLMPALGLNGQRLNTPDNYGPVLEKITQKMIASIRRISLIYLGLTLAGAAALTISGLSLYNGLIHSMSAVSTCGFSRYSDGIGHFQGPAPALIICIIMIISGMNWFLFLRRPRNGLRGFLKSSEIRLYGFFLGAAAILIAADLLLQTPAGAHRNDPHVGSAALDALFHAVSFLTTTGFAGTRYDLWPSFSQSILLVLMFCGACTASAGGGLKLARVSILLKLIRHGVSTRLHSNFFETVQMNGQGLPSDTVSGAATMPFLFFIALFSGTFLLTFGNVSLSEAFNASAACLCNTGHAFGAIAESGAFMSFGGVSKCVLSLLMLGGRLELYAIVILLTPGYWTQGR